MNDNDRSHSENYDSGFFRALLSYHHHQNSLMWSRVQFFAIAQAAVIGGAYSLYADNPSKKIAPMSLLGLGIVLTFILLQMMLRDEQLRDVNVKLIDNMGKALAPGSCRFIISEKPKKPAFFKATHLNWFVFCLFSVIDVTLAILICYGVSI